MVNVFFNFKIWHFFKKLNKPNLFFILYFIHIFFLYLILIELHKTIKQNHYQYYHAVKTHAPPIKSLKKKLN